MQLETIKMSQFHDEKMKSPILGFQIETERVFMPQRHVAGFTFSTEGAGSFDGKDDCRAFVRSINDIFYTDFYSLFLVFRV